MAKYIIILNNTMSCLTKKTNIFSTKTLYRLYQTDLFLLSKKSPYTHFHKGNLDLALDKLDRISYWCTSFFLCFFFKTIAIHIDERNAMYTLLI